MLAEPLTERNFCDASLHARADAATPTEPVMEPAAAPVDDGAAELAIDHSAVDAAGEPIVDAGDEGHHFADGDGVAAAAHEEYDDAAEGDGGAGGGYDEVGEFHHTGDTGSSGEGEEEGGVHRPLRRPASGSHRLFDHAQILAVSSPS